MSAAPTAKKRRLGEILLDAKLIDEIQLKAALSEQRKWGGKLGRTLVEMGFVDEESMVVALSRQLSLPAVDLDRLTTLPDGLLHLFRVDLAERYGVFPLNADEHAKVLQVATSDPSNMDAIQELSFLVGMRIQIAIAGSSAIDRAIRRFYYGESTVASDTAAADGYGLDERTFDAQPELPPAAPARPAPVAAAPAIPPEVDKRLGELTQRMAALEKAAANQVKALRVLFELLLEKGVITREEYVAKVRRE